MFSSPNINTHAFTFHSDGRKHKCIPTEDDPEHPTEDDPSVPTEVDGKSIKNPTEVDVISTKDDQNPTAKKNKSTGKDNVQTSPTVKDNVLASPTENEDNFNEENPTQEIAVVEYVTTDEEIDLNLSRDLYERETKDKSELESISSVDSAQYRNSQNISIFQNNNSIVDDDKDNFTEEDSSQGNYSIENISSPEDFYSGYYDLEDISELEDDGNDIKEEDVQGFLENISSPEEEDVKDNLEIVPDVKDNLENVPNEDDENRGHNGQPTEASEEGNTEASEEGDNEVGACCPVCFEIIDYEINLHLDECIKNNQEYDVNQITEPKEEEEEDDVNQTVSTQCPVCQEHVFEEINQHLDGCLKSSSTEGWIHNYIYSTIARGSPSNSIKSGIASPEMNTQETSLLQKLPSPPMGLPSSPEPEMPSPPVHSPNSQFREEEEEVQDNFVPNDKVEDEVTAPTKSCHTVGPTPSPPQVSVQADDIPEYPAEKTPPTRFRHTISPSPSPPTSPSLFQICSESAKKPNNDVIENPANVIDDKAEDLCSLETCIRIVNEPNTPIGERQLNFMEDGQRMTFEPVEENDDLSQEETEEQLEEENVLNQENMQHNENDQNTTPSPSVWGIFSLNPNNTSTGESPCKKKCCREKVKAFEEKITDLTLQLEVSKVETETGKKERQEINKEKQRLSREVLTVKRKLFEVEQSKSKKAKQGSSKDLKQGSSKDLNLDVINSQSPLYGRNKSQTEKKEEKRLKAKHRNSSAIVMTSEDREFAAVLAVKKKCEDLGFPSPTSYKIQNKYGNITADKIWTMVAGKGKIDLSFKICCILCGHEFKIRNPDNTRGIAPCRAVVCDVLEDGCGEAVYGAVCTPHTVIGAYKMQTYHAIEGI